MKILVTGFNPFGQENINPAIEVVKHLPDQIDNAEIIKLEIPTEFKKSVEVVRAVIQQHQPNYVINVGQAGGRDAITPELVAINFDDGRIPDNAGYQPQGVAIYNDGENAYFTDLPVKNIVANIRDAGIPSHVSTTAGTYVCNHIMYAVQYIKVHEFYQFKAGFIHIPFLPEQVVNKIGIPSLTLEQDVKGITIALKTIIECDE
jgi:pyroglutamyl-peptidase